MNGEDGPQVGERQGNVRGDEWRGRVIVAGNKAPSKRTCDEDGHCRYPCERQHGGDGDDLFK